MEFRASMTFLHQQHDYLMKELARISACLDNLSAKKARLDSTLGQEAPIARPRKRKLKQDRFRTNKSISCIQTEQNVLLENLREVEGRIQGWQNAWHQAAMLRAMPSFHYPWAWVSPFAHWYPAANIPPGMSIDLTSMAPHSPQWFPNYDNGLLQFDHSQPEEPFRYPHEILPREGESTTSETSRPDSGFSEPAMYMMPFDLPINYDPSDHVYSHELFITPQQQPVPQPTLVTSPAQTVVPAQIFAPPPSSFRRLDSLVSPHTIAPTSPSAPLTAICSSVSFASSSATANDDLDTPTQPQHTRRYSEAAVQLIERRLSEQAEQRKSLPGQGQGQGRGHARNKSSGNFSMRSVGSGGSSTYSPITPRQGARASLAAVREGTAGAEEAGRMWLD
ncbi:MAG: hypothetical protein M1820_001152 [Bogoriella megaspora]|nr:MAG: hypothetical protein M1820_001152 [Bogoriella megaspora]